MIKVRSKFELATTTKDMYVVFESRVYFTYIQYMYI